ncbi:MAG: TRAP transporter large permease subunit [Pseudomonadota bacterium]
MAAAEAPSSGAPAPAVGALRRVLDPATSALAAAATAWIFVLMILVCADVIGLKVFSRPVYGVVEVTAASIVAVVFAQLPHTLALGRLTRADFFIAPLAVGAPSLAKALEAAFAATGTVIFALLTIALWEPTWSAWADGDYIGTQGIFTMPIWPISLLVLLGIALTAVEFAVQTVERLGDLRAAPRPLLVSLTLVLIVAALGVLILILDPGRIALGVIGIAALVLLILVGMHVPVAMMLVGLIGVWVIRDNPDLALRTLRSATTSAVAKFEFGVVPLFVLMGLLVDASDLGRDAYRVAAALLRKLYGGLAIATVAANAAFAAVTGISIASAAVFTRIAVPQMEAHQYSTGFAAGTVAGSSVLGMMIPPSLLLIIFGFVTETSIGALFLAAIIPGLLLAVAFCVYIYLAARFAPERLGCPAVADDIAPVSWAEIGKAMAPILVLMGVVLGGIYGGVFTPTQAGAVGAAATLIVTALKGRLSAPILWKVMKDTGVVSVTILLLVIAASAFTKMLVMSGIPNAFAQMLLAEGVGFWLFILGYFAVIVILGMFLDSTSIILIVVPLVVAAVPQIVGAHVPGDVMVWFGIVTVLAVEIGLLTPPFGISVYVVKATLDRDDVPIGAIFRGALPFVGIMAAVMLVLTALPVLTTIWSLP